MKKYIVAVIVALLALGFVFGLKQNYNLTNVIKFTFSLKYFFYLLLILLLAFLLSCIGIPGYYIILVLDILCGGIVSGILVKSFYVKGFLFSLIFIIFIKLIFWFLLFLNAFYSLKLIKNNFVYLFKKYCSSKKNIKLYFKKIWIINTIILSFSLIFCVFGNKLNLFSKIFTFLIS